MVLATSNKARQLLVLTYAGHVRLDELVNLREEIRALVAELSSGLRVLADFTHMDAMDRDCTPEIGLMMETIDRIGVGTVVRVIPDPGKDVGLNILTHFHYRKHPHVVTCKSLKEALQALEL